MRTKQEDIDIRRDKVKRCMRLGMSYQQIADTLSCHKNTVVADVKALRSDNRELAVGAESFEEIGDHLSVLKEAERLAMVDYHTSKPGDAKRNSFLRTAMQARAEIIQLQQQAGIIPKVADNLNITGALEIMKMPDDALAKRLNELKQVIMASGDFEANYLNRVREVEPL